MTEVGAWEMSGGGGDGSGDDYSRGGGAVLVGREGRCYTGFGILKSCKIGKEEFSV